MIAALLLVPALALGSPPKDRAAAPKAPVERPAASPAGPDAALLAQAGADYERGRFADALAGYERLTARGLASAELAYDIGNTEWRMGRRGLAIVWWERARRLDPRDADIRFNLALARSALQDEEPSLGETLDRVLTPNELAWGALALLWLLAGAAGVALWRDVPWPRWRRIALTGVPVLVAATLWLGLRTRDLAQPWGVVVSPSVEIRSGPGDQYPVGYTAPEGQRVLVLSRRPGWVEIGVPARSLKGWVTDSSVSLI